MVANPEDSDFARKKDRHIDDGRERQKRLGASRLLLIGGLVSAACGHSPTAATSLTPTFNLTGSYTLTLRTSERCVTFPDSLQTVSFSAALKQQDFTFSLDVQVTLGGMHYPVTLHGDVQDNELRVRTADCVRFADEAFKSDVSPDETFGMCGSSVATIANPRHITGTFAGTLEYFKVGGPGHAASSTACSAPDHALILDAK